MEEEEEEPRRNRHHEQRDPPAATQERARDAGGASTNSSEKGNEFPEDQGKINDLPVESSAAPQAGTRPILGKTAPDDVEAKGEILVSSDSKTVVRRGTGDNKLSTRSGLILSAGTSVGSPKKVSKRTVTWSPEVKGSGKTHIHGQGHFDQIDISPADDHVSVLTPLSCALPVAATASPEDDILSRDGFRTKVRALVHKSPAEAAEHDVQPPPRDASPCDPELDVPLHAGDRAVVGATTNSAGATQHPRRRRLRVRFVIEDVRLEVREQDANHGQLDDDHIADAIVSATADNIIDCLTPLGNDLLVQVPFLEFTTQDDALPIACPSTLEIPWDDLPGIT